MTERFTDQDAQMIVDAAQSAPLANMASGIALAGALGRFQPFYREAQAALNERAAQVPHEPRKKK